MTPPGASETSSVTSTCPVVWSIETSAVRLASTASVRVAWSCAFTVAGSRVMSAEPATVSSTSCPASAAPRRKLPTRSSSTRAAISSVGSPVASSVEGVAKGVRAKSIASAATRLISIWSRRSESGLQSSSSPSIVSQGPSES